MENNRRGCTISTMTFVVATLILMILKLCGVMTYSWWWVFAPLAVIPAIFTVWFLVLVLICLITALIQIIE